MGKADTQETDDKDAEGGLEVTFKFSDSRKKFTLALDSLDLSETIEIEEYFGMPWGQIQAEGWVTSQRGWAILGTIARRRREPDHTFEKTLQAGRLKVEVGDRPTQTPDDSGEPSSD